MQLRRTDPDAPPPPWHTLQLGEALAAVESDGDGELSTDEARARLEHFGPNALPEGRVFHTVPFSLTEVVALGVVGSLVLWVEELRKLVVRRRDRRLAGDRPRRQLAGVSGSSLARESAR